VVSSVISYSSGTLTGEPSLNDTPKTNFDFTIYERGIRAGFKFRTRLAGYSFGEAHMDDILKSPRLLMNSNF
jgi:hypothetical protein